jgi:hypothetical protein
MHSEPCGLLSFTCIYTGRVVVSTGLGLNWSDSPETKKGWLLPDPAQFIVAGTPS